MTNRIPPMSPRRSPFADALRALLDDTGFLSRSGWAELLGISTAALSQWVNDKTLPRADLLRIIVEVLRSRGGAAAIAAIGQFETLMDRPAADISPVGARMGTDLRSYMARKSFLDFAHSLNGLDSDSQLHALESGSWGVEGPQPLPLPAGEKSDWSLQAGLVSRLKEAWPTTQLPRLEKDSHPGDWRWQDAWEHLAEAPRAIITGAPGSGKTTILSVLARLAYDRGEKPAQYSMSSGSADAFRSWMDRALDKHPKRTILVDGLDEVARDERRAAARHFATAAREAPHARFVIAARPVPELSEIEGFEAFRIASLTEAELVSAIAGAARRELRLEQHEGPRFLTHLYERGLLDGLLSSRMNFEFAWALFARQAVTPFWEGEVVAECASALLSRDFRKGLSRVREPWGSPKQLAQLAGHLSFRLLESASPYFDRRDAEAWLSDRLPPRAFDRFLDLMTVNGILVQDSERYSFGHAKLAEYFAALHCVASTAHAATCLARWPRQRSQRNVLRIACGISSDAGPLLRSVLRHDAPDDERYAILADLLSQPLAIDDSTLGDCCSRLILWLDDRVSGWKPLQEDTVGEASSAPWHMLVRAPGTERRVRAAAQALEALHRARSGAARALIQEHLRNAASLVLIRFAAAISIDGFMKVHFSEANALLRIEIIALHINRPLPIGTGAEPEEIRQRRLPSNAVDIASRRKPTPTPADETPWFEMEAAARPKGASGSPRPSQAGTGDGPIRGPIRTAAGIGQFNDIAGCVQFVTIGEQPPTWLKLGDTVLQLSPAGASPNLFLLPQVDRGRINKLLLQHEDGLGNVIEWG